jgi:hypothetical protein
MNNASKPFGKMLKISLVAALAFACTLARAQLPPSPSVGDWASATTLIGGGGDWDNLNPNSLGTSNTWEMYTGSGWVVESGTTAGTSYPSANTGLITILTGTTMTNSSNGASSNLIDGVIVQSNASFLFASGTNELGSLHTPDMDVFGNFGLQNGNEPCFFLDTGAKIVMESGSTMTNNGSAANDNFTGPGYTNIGLGTYVSNAITFKSNSLFVMNFNPSDVKGFIPHATWMPGSTCLIAPTAVASGFGGVPKGLPGQTFWDFIWNWPGEGNNHKWGSSSEAGSFIVAHDFYMTASDSTCTNNDFPYSGYAVTVSNNIGLTNVTWTPTASSGIVTINVGGNFWVDSTAAIKINSATAVGNVNFIGASPQTLAINGANNSPVGWNWTVDSGATVNLTSALVVNYGAGYSATVPGATCGTVTINGTLNLASTGTLSGTSNTIVLGSSGQFNVSAAPSNSWTFAAEDILEGSGTVIGDVTASSTSLIIPGSTNSGATLTFSGSLNYGGALSSNIFSLNSTPGSAGNSQIVVSGGPGSILHPNGAQIVINPLSTLSTNTPYVLYNVTGGGTVSESMFITNPAWLGTAPGNAAQFNIATNAAGTEVLLQYGTPAVTASAPNITGYSVSGTTLSVTINNAASGVQYTVLMSTNLTTPFASWATVGTFTPGSSGTYTAVITGAINPSDRQQFFELKAP